ncbi:MAG: Ppx/GppA family phosphatase [Deltaproteobacteria bacterium]|nr:Ppx/GppA family phosphatase [Deltaproteobacteria bacterium]
MARLATIDIGTNTTLLLLAESRAGKVQALAERAEITRLGRGIGADGGLGRAGIERTLAVLAEYRTIARAHGAAICAVGTEALRRAPNAQDFLVPAARILGAEVEVIDGEREAALTFLAAARSFAEVATGRAAVIDIGGGSTEIIVARAGRVELRRSLPLGSVRLTEKHIKNDPALATEIAAVEAESARQLAGVALPSPPLTLVGTAGTVTTLAAMSLGLASYDPARVHGHRLALAALEREIARLRASTQAERERMAGLDPKRADVILAGACILRQIVVAARVSEVLVNDRGIRWGLLYERAGDAA